MVCEWSRSPAIPSTQTVQSCFWCVPLHVYIHTTHPLPYQANHRSWADFFMEVVLTEGRGIMLSRMAVMYAFPLFMVPMRAIGACFIFKRGPVSNKDAFNSGLDKYLADSPQTGWVVYPEGMTASMCDNTPFFPFHRFSHFTRFSHQGTAAPMPHAFPSSEACSITHTAAACRSRLSTQATRRTSSAKRQ